MPPPLVISQRGSRRRDKLADPQHLEDRRQIALLPLFTRFTTSLPHIAQMLSGHLQSLIGPLRCKSPPFISRSFAGSVQTKLTMTANTAQPTLPVSSVDVLPRVQVDDEL